MIIEAEQGVQSVLYRVTLLIPTRQLTPEDFLLYGAVQRDLGIRQLFSQGYSGHERGYAASDDCNAGHGQALGNGLTLYKPIMQRKAAKEHP